MSNLGSQFLDVNIRLLEELGTNLYEPVAK